ncbi:MAG: HEAT repeat domain-containing protein, partial [Longimicrobiales bacterium]
MKRSLSAAIVASLIAGACATGGAPASTGPDMDESRWRGDARLYHILLPYPITAAQHDSLTAYARQHMQATNYLLAEAAQDAAAPVVVRVNALFVLAQRRADTHVHVFRNALDAEDVRVRAAAASAMRQFVTTHPQQAISVARMALSDPEPEVQAQALQVLGDEDVDLLREYVKRAPNAELRAVAQDLIQLAEQRGAPLLPDSASGVLVRRTSDGVRITFTPERHWPQWDAGYGTVRIASADGTVQT